MTNLDRTQLLEAYRNGPAELQGALDSLASEMWRFKPTPTSWSVHEIVVHLADAEVQSHVRFRTVISEPSSAILNHDEYLWSTALSYADQDLQLSLRVISLMRESNHALLASIRESMWGNACVHSVRGPETLDALVRGYVKHLRQHIAQMRRCWHSWRSAAER